jgi:hypothetical protein
MKYIAFIIWLMVTGVMVLTIIPAIICYAFTTWFDIGNKILESH